MGYQAFIIQNAMDADGALPPEQKHGGYMTDDDGSAREFFNGLAGDVMVSSCRPCFLPDQANQGQKLDPGEKGIVTKMIVTFVPVRSGCSLFLIQSIPSAARMASGAKDRTAKRTSAPYW